MRIKYSSKFFIYKRTGHEEKGASVRIRITLRGQQPFDISTGYIIPINDWDTETQTPKTTCPQAEEITRTINSWKATLSEAVSRYELIEKRIPTRDELKDLFNDLVGRDTPLKKTLAAEEANRTIITCLDIFTKTMGRQNNWTHSTFQRFDVMRKHIMRYNPHLSLQTLSVKDMQGYVEHLLSHGLRNTSIAEELNFFRWLLRWAARNGYYFGNLHETFRPKLKGITNCKEIIYLTLEELNRIDSHEFTPQQRNLERVRDVFVFCCFSGLRYSDVAKLKKADVKDDYIDIVTQKTSDGLRIELNKHTKMILDKYASLKGTRALPVLSNVAMNLHLKTLGKMCKLDNPTRTVYFRGTKRIENVYPKWQLLTTHVARRTFVVTALQLGIPAEVIMRWTGHSDYDSMKPYVEIVDELRRKSMQKFNEI